jgi:protein HOOK3
MLQKELQSLRIQKQEQLKELERIVVLENLLEDSNRLKTKFQEDYQSVYRESLHLRNEVQQLRSVPPGDGSRDAIARLNESESKLRRMKSESDMLKSTRRLSKRVSMITIAESKRDSFSSAAPADKKQLQDENRNLHSRVGLLDQENQHLRSQMDELRARNSELEKTKRYAHLTFSALNASLSVLESQNSNDDNTKSLVTATQKLNQFTEQNNQLHTALKQAKELILSQEKRIKQLSSSDSSENFVDAVQSLEASLKQKEAELARALQEIQDTRAAARREQRLIMSAWYELGMQLQRKNRQSTHVSWLSQQRSNLTKGLFSFPF